MPQPGKVEKAKLTELWPDSSNQLTAQSRQGGPAKVVTVQFNPQTLKTNFSNQSANGDKPNSPRQFVGQGTTKLSLEMWFDATRSDDPDAGGDVRNLTNKIQFFMTPVPVGDDKDKKYVVPGVKFSWGSFLFEGFMDSMDETIEFFSEQGVPLRASVSVTISKQEIVFRPPQGLGANAQGTQPLQAAMAGDSVQQMAARAGKGDWQSIAAANGIENPRQVPAGALVNMAPSLQGF